MTAKITGQEKPYPGNTTSRNRIFPNFVGSSQMLIQE